MNTLLLYLDVVCSDTVPMLFMSVSDEGYVIISLTTLNVCLK